MELTAERKNAIDSKSYYELLKRWRHAPCGDQWMEGATGEYWGKRMSEIRPLDHAQISKNIGWEP